jgi:DNA transformation protein
MADDSFKEFVFDQLSALPDVRAEAMFGAHGIYSGEHFFGILDEGRLFFKTDAASKADYTARGKVMTMSYHEVPPAVLENAPELTMWTQKAIQIAAAKPKKKQHPRSRLI